MASPATPLLDSHSGFNVTTRSYYSSRSPESIGSIDRPVTPHLTLHEYRKFQRSSFLSSSPDLDYKRVRRKASTSNLSGKSFDEPELAAPVTCAESWPHLNPAPTLLTSLLQPFPTSPFLRPATASPSLSSTITTLQSTPSQTPVIVDSSRFDPWRSEGGDLPAEPVRSKRKFTDIKLPKRLPKRTVESEWQVFAAIVDLGGDYQSLGQEEDAREADLEQLPGLRSAAQAKRQGSPEFKEVRSVKFAGLDSDSESAPPQQQPAGEEKESTLTSSLSLSKFKFPAPPGHSWAGTFGKSGGSPDSTVSQLTLGQDISLNPLHPPVQQHFTTEGHPSTW